MSKGKWLTEKDLDRMLSMFINGLSITEIAKRLKRDRGFVSRVLRSHKEDIDIILSEKRDAATRARMPPSIEIVGSTEIAPRGRPTKKSSQSTLADRLKPYRFTEFQPKIHSYKTNSSRPDRPVGVRNCPTTSENKEYSSSVSSSKEGSEDVRKLTEKYLYGKNDSSKNGIIDLEWLNADTIDRLSIIKFSKRLKSVEHNQNGIKKDLKEILDTQHSLATMIAMLSFRTPSNNYYSTVMVQPTGIELETVLSMKLWDKILDGGDEMKRTTQMIDLINRSKNMEGAQSTTNKMIELMLDRELRSRRKGDAYLQELRNLASYSQGYAEAVQDMRQNAFPIPYKWHGSTPLTWKVLNESRTKEQKKIDPVLADSPPASKRKIKPRLAPSDSAKGTEGRKR